MGTFGRTLVGAGEEHSGIVFLAEPASTIFLRQLEGGPLHLQLLFSYDEPPPRSDVGNGSLHR